MNINWMTVIVSIVFSTITASIISYNFLKKFISRLDKKTTSYIDEVKNISINRLKGK